MSTGLAARMAERTEAAQHLLRRRLVRAGAVAVTLALLAWVVLASPMLALSADRVEVVGAGAGATVSADDVIGRVAHAAGTPLLRVDTTDLADRVGAMPGVREAQVSRAWPRGLAVTVVPRVPVAAAESEDEWVLVDADGVQVATTAEAPEDVPRVAVPLDTSEETAPALEAVLTVLGALPADLLAVVASAGADSAESVVLTLADGAEVRWGSAAESRLKAEVLEVLRQEGAAVYDLTVPRAPTTS